MHQVSLGYDAERKRQRVSVYGETPAECVAKMAVKLAEIRRSGGVPVRESITVAQHLASWLARRERDVAAGTLERATYDTYERHVRLHLLGDPAQPKRYPRRTLATMRLDRVRVRDGEAWLNELAVAGVGARSRQVVRMVLAMAFKSAMRSELVDRNPIELVAAPKHVSAEFSVWDVAEANAFLEAARADRLFAYWVLSLSTGARPHEMLGLRPELDVDLASGTISINAQLRRFGQDRVPTKTRASRRTIKLAPFAATVLREHRSRMFAEGLRASPWFFPAPDGTAMNYRKLVSEHYEPTVARATWTDESGAQQRLMRIRPYDLRHTYATLALSAGVPLHVVSRTLGHTNPAFTAKVYAHLTSSLERQHISAIEALYGTGIAFLAGTQGDASSG